MEKDAVSSESVLLAERRAIVAKLRKELWVEAVANKAVLEHFASIQTILRDRVRRCDDMLDSLDAIPEPVAGAEVEESEMPW